jgi:hypothetical protein
VQLYDYFVSQSSEFCGHNPLYCFSTSVYHCCLFRYDSVRELLDTPSYEQTGFHFLRMRISAAKLAPHATAYKDKQLNGMTRSFWWTMWRGELLRVATEHQLITLMRRQRIIKIDCYDLITPHSLVAVCERSDCSEAAIINHPHRGPSVCLGASVANSRALFVSSLFLCCDTV